MVEESWSLEHTPIWVVAVICFDITVVYLVAECSLHWLGKLLLLVGAELEHIITRIAQEAAEKTDDQEATPVKHSDTTYWFHSCIMEKLGFIIPRLLMGVLVQVLCSNGNLPFYALVTQDLQSRCTNCGVKSRF